MDPEALLARAYYLLGKSAEDSQFSGRLDLIGYPELLQLLEANRSSGTLTLSGGEIAGRLVFLDGAVVSASAGEVRGEDAALMLLWIKEGSFVFEPQILLDNGKGQHDVPEGGWRPAKLIIDASFLEDELRQLGPRAPQRDDLIAVKDTAAALGCFPGNDRWRQFVEAREAQPLTYVAQMLHMGTQRCRVVLGKKIQSGALQVV